MKKKIPFLIISILFLSLLACDPKAEAPDALALHIDKTIKPGDDFFSYANGQWFKENPIPASEQQNGLWQLIQDTINAQILNLCQSSAALSNAEKGSNKQKIGDYYFTGMDSVALNSKGLSDLNNEFTAIDEIKKIDGIIKQTAQIHTVSGAPLFNMYVGQDDKNSEVNALFIAQGGLSLPNKRYYFDTDEKTVVIRQKFVEHLTNLFKLMGYDETKSINVAKEIMKLETAIANTSRKREDTRDPWKNYNKVSFKQLLESTPNINWAIFTSTMGLSNVDSVIIGQPEFFTALNGYLKSTSLDVWKNYLKYHLVRGLARYLDDKTYQESFNFYSTVMRGVKEPKPRWKRVVEQTDGSLGELIGQVYVSDYLPKGTKEKLQEIGEAIRTEFAERIKNLEWMSQETKVKALEKLASIVMKVGYPDKWKDLSTMSIDRTSYVKNVMSANTWQTQYAYAKYGKPVDRTEWGMTPQTYNAYYNPSNNEIVVPGCNIIVPGYEGRLADDAILYSIIGGSTFGHEITHGFDDQGSKYDAKGNLRNWWSKEDSAKFTSKTKQVVEQFNSYVAVDSLHINGELTQGENIADIGGVAMGYEAFKKTEQFKSNKKIGGLNPNERFFLGYALAWMINQRPEAIANQVKSNEHSPAKFRVIGPLANMPIFHETFGIKKGEKMWLDESLRANIW